MPRDEKLKVGLHWARRNDQKPREGPLRICRGFGRPFGEGIGQQKRAPRLLQLADAGPRGFGAEAVFTTLAGLMLRNCQVTPKRERRTHHQARLAFRKLVGKVQEPGPRRARTDRATRQVTSPARLSDRSDSGRTAPATGPDCAVQRPARTAASAHHRGPFSTLGLLTPTEPRSRPVPKPAAENPGQERRLRDTRAGKARPPPEPPPPAR